MQRTLISAVAASAASLAIAAGSVALSAPDASAAVAPAAAVAANHPRAGTIAAWIRAHRRAITRATIERSAAVIGVTPTALVTALRSGQSIAQVAQAHGVQPAAVSDALVATGDARISSLEANHKITALRADRLRLRLDRAVAKLMTHHFR